MCIHVLKTDFLGLKPRVSDNAYAKYGKIIKVVSKYLNFPFKKKKWCHCWFLPRNPPSIILATNRHKCCYFFSDYCRVQGTDNKVIFKFCTSIFVTRIELTDQSI